jgi:succinylglutamate desuccinylase
MQEISSGIWQVSGSRPGPHLVKLGGVHGDEKTGIEVVKKLHALFKAGKKTLSKGTLILILGNKESIRMNTRGTSPEHNLNRMFTSSHLAGPVLDFYESSRAHELAPLLRNVEISWINRKD